MKKILTMLVISLLILSMMFFAPLTFATSATIWTDKADYSPGETVTIFGSGFLASAEVTITIERPNKWLDTVYAVTDNVGSFTCTYLLNGIEGTYTVTATDGTNTASTTFTDVKPTFTITIDTINGILPPWTTPLTNPIHLAGSASAWPNFPGQLSQYQVYVNWGDGTEDMDSTVNFVQSGTTFSGTWSSNPDHSYTTGGQKTITVRLYHGQYQGAESADAQYQAIIQVAPTTANIIVKTSPSGLSIVVNSVTYTAPQTFSWVIGSTNSIGTTSPQPGLTGVQYVWTSWNDSGAITHNIITPNTPTTYTATFKTQYLVSFTQTGSGVAPTVTYTADSDPTDTVPFTVWVKAGSTIYYSYQSIVSGASGIRYVLIDTSPASSQIVNGPMTILGTYKTQYYLTVVSLYSTTSGEDWYDADTNAYADVANAKVDLVPPGWVRAVFTGWSGDASGTNYAQSNPILMDSPKTAIALWQIQYYLDVVSDPNIPPPIPGANWYNNCTWVELTAPQYKPDEAGVGGVRYVFSYWDVDGTPVSGNPIDIHMNTYHIATAHYIVQYYLTLATSPAGVNAPSVEGWYNGGTYASISTDEYVDIVPGSSRYRFNGWTTADMPEITDPSLTSTTVLMDKAKTVTADYVIQYYLTVKTDPEGLVTIPGEGWYDYCTYVDLTAPPVTCHVFVYWDVDGTNTPGNPRITVHMDDAHTATAHYWPCLEYEQFVTDSSFNEITKFDTVWTPKDMKKTTFKLASTNPGQFYLNIKITNTWPVNTGTITVSYTLDPDFIIHPIQGDPIQVWTGYGITGTRIPATVTYGASGTVTISGIALGQTVYITIHMEYGPAREYFDKATMLDWKLHHASNTFSCGYTVTVPGPFPFVITNTSSTTITDPIVVLGLED
jgi:hypothetical protein